MKKYIWFICLFVAFFLFCSVKVEAYERYCTKNIIAADRTYKLCDDNVYVMPDDIEYSSYLVADRNVTYKTGIILYAGNIDGMETFYSTGFNYYGVVYDDRGFLTSKNNIWSDLSINGVLEYTGRFDDNVLVDESSSGYIHFYNEVGTYLIRQYIAHELKSYIKVIVVGKDDIDLNIDSAMFGDNKISDENVVDDGADLKFAINGGKYGFGGNVEVEVNSCKINVLFSKELVVNSAEFKGCLKLNERNEIGVTIYNGLARKKTFKYYLKLVSDKVEIKLENSVSEVVTSSRRILIKASAGVGKTLDEEHCLYYWSKNADDKLTYEDFMTNYSMSENKGRYASNKGVILRDSDGVYYLYALAMDDDSTTVVRSDKYILQKSEDLNTIIWEDILLVLIFGVCAIIPIIIYVYIRGKDTI